MANVLTSAVCSTCCDIGLVNFCGAFAPLSNFNRQCSPDALAAGQPVIVRVSSATAAQVNPTNFETNADTSITGISITPAHLSKSFQISQADYLKGIGLANVANAAAVEICKAAWAIVNPLIKNNADPALGFPVANTVVKAVASITPADIGAVWSKLLCSPRHFIATPDVIAKMMYQTGGCCFPMGGTGAAAFGFDSVSVHSDFTGADANTIGFGYCPNAIIIVAGVPPVPPVCDGLLETSTITVPGCNISVQFNLWCSSATRSMYGSYDLMFGAARGVICQGVTLKSA